MKIPQEHLQRLADNMEERTKAHGPNLLVMPGEIVLEMARELLEQRKAIAAMRVGYEASLS